MTGAPRARKQAGIERLLEVMARLRDPESGCPWDRAQSFETIAAYTIEEAYEVAEAIRQNDRQALRDELGDLLFQVVFYAQMAQEEGGFDFDVVAHEIAEKMVRRHPHVFGPDATAGSRAESARERAWEDRKAAERAEKAAAQGRKASILDGVALSFPALLRAQKLQKRAARIGFDWPSDAPVFDKLNEEIEELRAAAEPGDVAEEVGDLLFACVNLARHMGVDAETALREANRKFERRFRKIEARVSASGGTLENTSLEAMDRLWEEAKRTERDKE